MQGHSRWRLLRYGVAVLAVAGALNLKLLLVPWLERESPFPFFLAAVMVSAWYGGLKPGLLATVLSVPVIDFFFLEPIYTLDFGLASGNSLSLALFLGEGGGISLLVGSLYAARRAAEGHARELQAGEERYRRIVETAFEGIWSRDAEGRTNYVNPRMAEMLGYPAAEMLGRPWEDFVDAQDWPNVRSRWKQRRRGTTDQYEIRFRRRDGSDLWVIVTSNPIFRDPDIFDGALAMLTDVTERKQAEEALRRANEELESKVAERTADLERANARLQAELAERHRVEEALHRAKEAAEVANQAKSIFLANVSHEIRNPMNVLLVATDLLRETDVTAKQAEYLQIIRASTQSLLAVINDLLDLSKIEAGKLELDHLPFRLEDCLGKTLKALALRAHTKGLELACALDPAVPELLLGDPNRLGQVLTNLIGNAVKFTERGEVVVRVRSEGADKETRRQGDRGFFPLLVSLSPCLLVF